VVSQTIGLREAVTAAATRVFPRQPWRQPPAARKLFTDLRRGVSHISKERGVSRRRCRGFDSPRIRRDFTLVLITVWRCSCRCLTDRASTVCRRCPVEGRNRRDPITRRSTSLEAPEIGDKPGPEPTAKNNRSRPQQMVRSISCASESSTRRAVECPTTRGQENRRHRRLWPTDAQSR
jgi:hypothetical protein